MTVHEARRYEMFVRITLFGEQYAQLFPDGSVGAQALTGVAAAAAQLRCNIAELLTVVRRLRERRRLAVELPRPTIPIERGAEMSASGKTNSLHF